MNRRFEAIWTVHPRAVRRAAEVAPRLVGSVDAEYGEERLERRPVGAFQRAQAYERVRFRYGRIARQSDAEVREHGRGVERRDPGSPVEIPIDLDDAIGNEWAVIVDAPGYCGRATASIPLTTAPAAGTTRSCGAPAATPVRSATSLMARSPMRSIADGASGRSRRLSAG